jgi:hypothetical protein
MDEATLTFGLTKLEFAVADSKALERLCTTVTVFVSVTSLAVGEPTLGAMSVAGMYGVTVVKSVMVAPACVTVTGAAVTVMVTVCLW